jgi:hypothetical protein
MSKLEINLSGECVKTITELSITYPNDMEFGKHVRVLIQDVITLNDTVNNTCDDVSDVDNHLN